MSIRIVEKKDTFPVIMRAVEKLVEFVAPTYGPASNKVIIDKNLYKMVVDDGVQICRDFELPDDAENAVVRVIKQTAIRTNDRVGDGTTGSMIMLRSIMREIERLHYKDGRKISNELKKGVAEAVAQLRSLSKVVKTKEELKRVAMVAYDNEEVATMIADMLYTTGKDGNVEIEVSHHLQTTSEKADGFKFRSGYTHDFMITNIERLSAELKNVRILVTSYKLVNAGDIVPVMNTLLTNKIDTCVIICDGLEGDALATVFQNRIKAPFFKTIAVTIPHANKKEFLEDVCMLTGATLFGEDTGGRLENIQISDFGIAESVKATQTETSIRGGRGDKREVNKTKSRIRAALATNPKEGEKNELKARLARLAGVTGIIRVGALTEAEQKALKYKVEDAVNATRAAMDGGVVPGGGMALRHIKTSSELLNRALKAPSKQLFVNVGMEDVDNLKKGEAYNVVSGERGGCMKVGVIDPTDVLVAGIESATSIASLLATCHGILVEETPKPENN